MADDISSVSLEELDASARELYPERFKDKTPEPKQTPTGQSRSYPLLEAGVGIGADFLTGNPLIGTGAMTATRMMERAARPPQNPMMAGASQMIPPPLGPPLYASQVLDPKELVSHPIGDAVYTGVNALLPKALGPAFRTSALAGGEGLYEKAASYPARTAARYARKAAPQMMRKMAQLTPEAARRMMEQGGKLMENFKFREPIRKAMSALTTMKTKVGEKVGKVYDRFGLGDFGERAKTGIDELAENHDLIKEYPDNDISQVKAAISKAKRLKQEADELAQKSEEEVSKSVDKQLKELPVPKAFRTWEEVPQNIKDIIVKQLGIQPVKPPVPTPVPTAEELIDALENISPQEQIKQMVLHKREIYKHLKTLFEKIPKEVHDIAESWHGGLLDKASEIKDMIQEIPGSHPLKKADAAYSEMMDIYHTIQPKISTVGRARNFYEKMMEGTDNIIKEDVMPKMRKLQEKSGVKFLEDIKNVHAAREFKEPIAPGYMGKFAMSRIPEMAVGGAAAGVLGYKHPKTLGATIPALAMLLATQSPAAWSKLIPALKTAAPFLEKYAGKTIGRAAGPMASDILGTNRDGK